MQDRHFYIDLTQTSASTSISTEKKPKLYTFLPSKEEEDEINK